MRVFLDTNVVIDALQNREPWVQDSKMIFHAVASKEFIGCITTKQLADIHYFSRKTLKGQDHIDKQARVITRNLLILFELVDTLAIDCKNAYNIMNGDYEDAILIATAERESADYIITRNPDHFKVSTIPILSPSEFVLILYPKDTENDSQ